MHVDSVVRAEPAFGRLGTAAVDVHSVEFHALSFGGADQGVNELSHGGEPNSGVRHSRLPAPRQPGPRAPERSVLRRAWSDEAGRRAHLDPISVLALHGIP